MDEGTLQFILSQLSPEFSLRLNQNAKIKVGGKWCLYTVAFCSGLMKTVAPSNVNLRPVTQNRLHYMSRGMWHTFKHKLGEESKPNEEGFFQKKNWIM